MISFKEFINNIAAAAAAIAKKKSIKAWKGARREVTKGLNFSTRVNAAPPPKAYTKSKRREGKNIKEED